MKIRQMHLKNFRAFSDAVVEFDPRLTVFIGTNGAGKSTMLDALAIPLKMIAENRLQWPNNRILKEDLKVNCAQAQIEYQFADADKTSLTYSIYDQSHPESEQDYKQTQELNAQFAAYPKPVIARYGSKRIINDYKRNQNAHVEAEYAFKNAFEAGIDFSSTLTWFIEKTSEEAMKGKRLRDLAFTLPELDATRKAVSKALGDYGEPYVDETPHKLFITHKDAPDVPLNLQQLSDGYRTMLALVMDLARRMALASSLLPNGNGNILDYQAIVLIDEVELHLHPAWQQRVLPALLEIFGNTQFIVTTHSPQIISSIKPEHVRLLSNGFVSYLSTSTYGAESQRILEEVFGVSPRYRENEAKKELDKYFEYLNRGETDSKEVIAIRQKLDEWMLGDPILDSADLLIRRIIRQRETNA